MRPGAAWWWRAVDGKLRRIRRTLGTGRNPLRVVRGGSWNNAARNCRSANRNRNDPQHRNANQGFRVWVVPGTGEEIRRTTSVPAPESR
ncbi:MAG: SUMF1/EgtB/PvdO family nonheme iron enzyme [Verrucomicrobiota bacterium]